MDSDAGVPTVFGSWQALVLVVSGLFLNIPTNFLSSEGDSLSLFPDLGKVETRPNNFDTPLFKLMTLE